MTSTLKFVAIGVLFASLWASATIAAKFGLRSVEPLVLFSIRFLAAGMLLLTYAYGVEKQAMPDRRTWGQLLVFSLLNTSIYLGLFVFAMKQVTAGIGSLAIATNPLFIVLLSSIWVGRSLGVKEWISLFLGLVGVGIAAYPLLQQGNASTGGLLLLGLSMLSYSAGAIYYAQVDWSLSRTAINGWQVFFGGLMLSPLAYWLHRSESHFDFTAWLAIGWLILPVSVVSVQLWLWLLRTNEVKASFFLFLCPIFGFFYAWLLLQEPLTVYTFAGTALVLVSLYGGQNPASRS